MPQGLKTPGHKRKDLGSVAHKGGDHPFGIGRDLFLIIGISTAYSPHSSFSFCSPVKTTGHKPVEFPHFYYS